jgi:phage-Barnase-EndoU-ColicinE5/D-RelE like nuclease3
MMMTEELRKQINDLYDECLENFEQFHRKIDLFEISESLANRIKENTDVDLFGFWVCIDNFGIIHTLENHGNPVSEAKRGQIAVEKEDFITMVEVCLNPDDIKLIGNSKHTQKPLMQFEKRIENKIFVVKEVRIVTSTKKKKKNRLFFIQCIKLKPPIKIDGFKISYEL